MAIHDVEHCECYEVHKDLVNQVMNRMPDEDELYDLAELFKMCHLWRMLTPRTR